MRKHYTPAEVAELVGVTRKTVYAWIHSGYLPAVRVGPKLWHVTQAHLDALAGGQESAPLARSAPVVDSKSDLGGPGGGVQSNVTARPHKAARNENAPALVPLSLPPAPKGRKRK